MDRQRFEPIWPFLSILVGLFILSVVSPRTWQRAIRDETAAATDSAVDGLASRGSLHSLPDLATALGEIHPLGSVTNKIDTQTAQTESAVEPRPSLALAAERISQFEAIQPAPKLASRPLELDWPQAQPLDPVMPSLGAKPLEEEEPAEDPLWLPLPSPIGSMTLVDGARFDDAVLPVRRPQVASDGFDAARSTVWPDPEALFDQLDELSWNCQTGEWAREVSRLVRKLGYAVSDESPATASILTQLYDLGAEADQLADHVSDRKLSSEVLRVQHAFGRRMDLWRRVIVPGEPLSPYGRLTQVGLNPHQETPDPFDPASLLWRLEQYEKTRLNDLIEALPHLGAELQGIVGRLWDLAPVIRSSVYHPHFYGSFSLKAVLPVLVPEMSYDALDIQEGTAAQIAYEEMIDAGTSPERKAELRQQLLEYCKHDTLAMVRLHEKCLELSDAV